MPRGHEREANTYHRADPSTRARFRRVTGEAWRLWWGREVKAPKFMAFTIGVFLHRAVLVDFGPTAAVLLVVLCAGVALVVVARDAAETVREARHNVPRRIIL